VAFTQEQIRSALKSVKYPGFSRDIVSFGLIKEIVSTSVETRVQMVLTTNDAAVPRAIKAEAEDVLRKLGVPNPRVLIDIHAPPAGVGSSGVGATRIPGVKHIIAIASGKGGVGKSTVAANLAVALKMHGAATGLLDADIYGPSVPIIMGVKGEPKQIDVDGSRKIEPTMAHGLPVMSIGFFLDPDQAVIWRGPMLGKALHQLMADVHWGDLDYLVVDMPPGTGDVQITFSQQLKVSGALLVATPQEVALADVVRAKSMFDKVMIPIVGIVENMSYFVCDGCGKKHEIFSRGGAQRVAERFKIPYLGEIPITPSLREGGDKGVPSLIQDPKSEVSQSFLAIAAKLAGQLSIVSEQAKKAQGLKIVSS